MRWKRRDRTRKEGEREKEREREREREINHCDRRKQTSRIALEPTCHHTDLGGHQGVVLRQPGKQASKMVDVVVLELPDPGQVVTRAINDALQHRQTRSRTTDSEPNDRLGAERRTKEMRENE
jgi:hypothetical protein